MSQELTLEELSARTGEPVERLREWRSLGLIGHEGRERFELEDVERVRLIQLLLRRGIGLEYIARVEREQRLLNWYMETAFPGGVREQCSLAEAAKRLRMEMQFARQLWEGTGLADLSEGVSPEDLAMLRRIKGLLDTGYPKEAVVQLVRVFADALARVAEAGSKLEHFYSYERLKGATASDEEAAEARRRSSQRLQALAKPTVLYFLRKGRAKAAREDVVMHIAEEAGLLEEAHVPAQLRAAIAFVDLSSFTPLAEAMGDAKAAAVLERFSKLVRESAHRWDGRVVKQIGDAFMLVFPDARVAVACALEIERRAVEEPQFSALRVGVQSGTVLYREGDYVGSNVNIASRLASEAKRHQVLLTAAARKEAGSLPGVEFVRLGKRRLKGLAEELVLFEARSSFAPDSEKAIDPVCGMELGPAEVAARLSLEGPSTLRQGSGQAGSGERAFCSEECLRLFVASPERYSA